MFEADSPDVACIGAAAGDDSLIAAASMPSSPLMTACIGNRHASTPSTPLVAPRRRSAAVLSQNSSVFDSLIVDVDVTNPEQLVLKLSEQLHEKDMKLTDVRLEALSSAHQLEQLRETLNRMKVEMLQLKADNERMQRTISQNGLKELQAGSPERETDSLKKKLSIGDPTTFDSIALESGTKDSKVFNVHVELRLDTEAGKQEQVLMIEDHRLMYRLLPVLKQDDSCPRLFPVGTLSMTSRTPWSTLDEMVAKVFKSYVGRLDPGTALGLSEESIVCYRVGDITRTRASSPPELLPCGYLVGDNRDVTISLRGPEDGSVDELSFNTLIPKSIVERYVSLLVEHRQLILCGPSGTGKTFLARKLARHLVHLAGRLADTGAIETFNVDQKSGREVRHYLSNIADLCAVAAAAPTDTATDSSAGRPPPTVIIVDNLHHVTSLADTFSTFFDENLQENSRPYVIGTMKPSSSSVNSVVGGNQSSTSSATDLQLTHHNFRWVLFTNHSEPVRGLLGRYLQRRLAAEELARRTGGSGTGGGHQGAVSEEVGRVVAWLPKVWSHINQFLETNCSADVTLGPRLFLKCPMDEVASRVWFADLWNYSIVPYLHEALREARKGQCQRGGLKWEDPTDWVNTHMPWSTQHRASSTAVDSTPTLQRLKAEDSTPAIGDDQVASSQLSGTSGSDLESTRPKSSVSGEVDPLMSMLMRLQEATMSSSVYGGDGLEISVSDSWNDPDVTPGSHQAGTA